MTRSQESSTVEDLPKVALIGACREEGEGEEGKGCGAELCGEHGIL